MLLLPSSHLQINGGHWVGPWVKTPCLLTASDPEWTNTNPQTRAGRGGWRMKAKRYVQRVQLVKSTSCQFGTSLLLPPLSPFSAFRAPTYPLCLALFYWFMHCVNTGWREHLIRRNQHHVALLYLEKDWWIEGLEGGEDRKIVKCKKRNTWNAHYQSMGNMLFKDFAKGVGLVSKVCGRTQWSQTFSCNSLMLSIIRPHKLQHYDYKHL